MVLGLAGSTAGSAQSMHAPLQLSSTLDFQALLAATLQQAPEQLETPVRAQQAADFVAAGESWMAGVPNLSLNYYDDRWLDERGQFEAQYGVVLPLWRPGEKRQASALGIRYEEQVARWQSALQLTLAGRLRAVLADIAEAEILLASEREATATAAELVQVTTALFAAGVVARLDVMQTENLLLEQRKRELQGEAALVDAEIAYRLLTGLEVRPAEPLVEAQVATEEIAETHPLLQYLQSDIAIATASIKQSEIAALGNPQLGLGSRRERGDGSLPYTDTVNISLTVPFGGKSYVSAQSSAARRGKVDAEVQYLSTWRALQQALHEVEHELFLASQALPLAEQQAALGSERQAMAQGAFAQGEVSLIQVLAAVQEARIAARDLQQLRLQQQRLAGEYNQIIGVLP
jgi:outer membrane protein, heavy metal efflux system